FAGDRVGHDARAHEVRRVHPVRADLRRRDLPAHRPLGLRRRPVQRVRRRRAGLRRVVRRPPHRRHRRAGGADLPRAEEGQVRPRRKAAGDPRPLDAAVRPRRPDPLARLVRLQRRLDAGHGRRPLRRGRRGDEPGRRGRRHRRAAAHPARPEVARRRHDRQRRDRRPGRHHGALGLRRVLGRAAHRLRRRRDRRRRRAHVRAPAPRRPGRRAVRARPGRHLGHALLRPVHLRPPRRGRRRRQPRPAVRRRARPAGLAGPGRPGHVRRGLRPLVADVPGDQGDDRAARLRRAGGGRPRHRRARHVRLPRAVHPGARAGGVRCGSRNARACRRDERGHGRYEGGHGM
ncbi:MAG: Ammonium transporter, partial [uncultured Solirubrobacteraceae bacterium]